MNAGRLIPRHTSLYKKVMLLSPSLSPCVCESKIMMSKLLAGMILLAIRMQTAFFFRLDKNVSDEENDCEPCTLDRLSGDTRFICMPDVITDTLRTPCCCTAMRACPAVSPPTHHFHCMCRQLLNKPGSTIRQLPRA